MNLEEIAQTLPNGFHDAELLRIQMDYVCRTLDFELDVWIGEMEPIDRGEVYRPGRLMLTSVAYLVMEPPDAKYPWHNAGPLRIDSGEGRPSRNFD